MGIQVFSVLTEFKFDIASAVANSEILQESTKSLSDVADRALLSVKTLGLSFTSALGLQGAVGFFKKAMEASDNFQNSALNLTGVLTANMSNLTGPIDTFNQRLSVSKQTLRQIAETADNLGINSGDVLETFKNLIPGMVSLDEDISLKDTTTMAGNAAAGASALGLSPSEMAAQVSAILSSSAAEGALMNVLQTMPNAFKGKSLGAVNSMADDEIYKRLSAGLQQIATDMSDVSERANMFSTQLAKFKNIIFGDENGIGGLIKPIGDAIKPVFVDIFKGVNGYLKVQGTQIVGNFTQLIKSFIDTPRNMFANLMQMKESHNDLGKAAMFLGLFSSIEGLGLVIAKVTKIAAFGNPIIGALAAAIGIYIEMQRMAKSPIADMTPNIKTWAAGLLAAAGVLYYFGNLAKFLSIALGGVLIPMTVLFGIMQAMSRAKALASFDSGIAVANMMPQFSALVVRLKMAIHNILLPFEAMVDGFTQIMLPFFQWSKNVQSQLSTFETYVSILEMIGNGISFVLASLSGAFSMLFEVLLNLQNKGITHMFDDMGKSFTEGYDDFIKGHKQKMDEGKNVSNSNVYISKVEINNDLKAGMEPDRIAYTIQDQLLKATQNISKAKGSSLQAAYASR